MRILVSPASKYGGTAEIGRVLARALRDCGVDVDVTQPEDVHDLSPYSGFVLGSGLYMGKWLPKATDFIDEQAVAIRQLPTWLFSSGPLGDAKPAEPIRPDVLDRLLDETGALDHRLFGGRLKTDLLGRTDRFIARWVKAEDGDYREWDDITAWATAIGGHFIPQPTTTEVAS